MMLAASDPDDTGPIVINGAPMSYWGGAWQEGGGDNPMRYSGGMLGGTWLASLASDLGDGVFDGAYLVENFENLNPANTFWDKYYHLYANVDTEPPRFLEFERWWGGFYLMNREEIEWITRNLFVGNKLWTGDTRGPGGKAFDLRDIKAPIVLFASMGDNITPPQQAFNWVADVYGSTDEIKARGQVIVGSMHENVGHLGIFVSGKVGEEGARADRLGAEVDRGAAAGAVRDADQGAQGRATAKVEYECRVRGAPARGHRRAAQPLRPRRREAVRGGGGDLRVQPARLRAVPAAAGAGDVQRVHGEAAAAQFHPLRLQRWALSDLNPWLGWLGPAARAGAGAARGRRARTTPRCKVEKAASVGDQRLARLLPRDARRDERGRVLPDLRQRVLAVRRRQARGGRDARRARRRAARAAVRQGGAARRSREGGYPEALARVACLLARKGEPLLLSRLQMKQELMAEYQDLLPAMPPDQWRRVRGEQEIIVRYEPERGARDAARAACATTRDRERLVTLVQRLLADERVQRAKPSHEQLAMIEHIGETLAVDGAAASRATRAAQAGRKADAQIRRKRTPTGTELTPWNARHEKYQKLLDFCKALPPTPTAVAHPCDESSLRGAVDAAQLGLIAPILVGPRARIEARGEGSTASTSATCRSSTRPTARRPPRRRSSSCARARPRR